MPAIETVTTAIPPYQVTQTDIAHMVRSLFAGDFIDIDRLLTVFDHSQIHKRQLVKPLDWYQEPHSFGEKNQAFVEHAVQLGSQAVEDCIKKAEASHEDITAIISVTSTGLATPSIEVRIMNELKLPVHMKRIPLWGLGCGGGAAGLARAYEFCRAYPDARVLVLCIELCSLTFQHGDRSKSNLVGTSLFSDGVACALIVGDDVPSSSCVRPYIVDTASTLMPDSERVMGWDVGDNGLHVIFSRDIPTIASQWLGPNIEQFLQRLDKEYNDITAFVAHPGGRKVLEAYEKALVIPPERTAYARKVLENHGNMSSPTVLYVLKEIIESGYSRGDEGLVTALGPGFSSELLWLEWR
ncbi:alkylresorcinol/alkylpyrone synthase [Geomicrobium halophilum]|uniref:Alkylresorcinol/alkylpyrone synthase n=1 Tax=Geomicrobium halophilum TaxID=549000 RepID=A0A841PQ12_9BACL|nr:3-oxoacyl-[acyl-carrier-protein] synthase III C-terminal domain-containing protein [Geomicrobium halophilum]MBB6450850.1 alkylresorcinol/alkylpyrone synthase [Geomicrobium halophilum]